MIKRLQLTEDIVLNKILELQRASYAVEAQLLGFDGIPALTETVEALKCCKEEFYGYFFEDSLAGIISYKIIGTSLDIHRVAVHPAFFRKGIADKLLEYIEGININQGLKNIIVSTGSANLPAIRLYYKHGFIRSGEKQVSEGVYVTFFRKDMR